LERIAQAARCGVDFIQLREKDLSVRELESLAYEAVKAVRKSGSKTQLLVNSRTDVAIASGADGVHLRADDVLPAEVRAIYNPGRKKLPVVGVSCHDIHDVERAVSEAATFAVFAPVFEKRGVHPAGLGMLVQVCLQKIPVLALGGVTVENAAVCIRAGAAGVAGIRLFQDGDLQEKLIKLHEFEELEGTGTQSNA
jgi:thiamine-phosphate pyrophosphorylase